MVFVKRFWASSETQSHVGVIPPHFLNLTSVNVKRGGVVFFPPFSVLLDHSLFSPSVLLS